jgi:hypothetical protein
MAYYPASHIYDDYGTNVIFETINVYVNGQDLGTKVQYCQQRSDLAEDGAAAEAPADGEWLPLGVFALTRVGATHSVVSIQLVVNKEGIIRIRFG